MSTESRDEATDASSAGLEGARRGPVRETSEKVLEIRDVSKQFAGVRALDGVSLDIYDDEVLALIGDNGAGKSTLIKIISGVLNPTAGKIQLKQDGEWITHQFEKAEDAKDAGIETVHQDLALSTQHDVASNIFMGREPVRDDLLGRLVRTLDYEKMKDESFDALDEIGFQIDPTAPTSELSGGQQQAVAVARSLITDPKIMLMDEPTSEVSVAGAEKILDLIERLRDQGKAVVFITHNLQEVIDVADRIAVLRSGRLIEVMENDGVDPMELVALMTGGKRGSMEDLEDVEGVDGVEDVDSEADE